MEYHTRLIEAAYRQGYRREAIYGMLQAIRAGKAEFWQVRLIQEIIRTRHAYKVK